MTFTDSGLLHRKSDVRPSHRRDTVPSNGAVEQGTGSKMLQDVNALPGMAEHYDHPFDRIGSINHVFSDVRQRLAEFCELAESGLQRMVLPGMHFPHTMRAVGTRDGMGTRPEGDSLRYAINVAQGLGWTDEEVQRTALLGRTAVELVQVCVGRAERSGEPGAVALAAWAAAETAEFFAPKLFEMLERYLGSGKPVETVSCAWALTAALAARHLGPTRTVQQLASRLLLRAQASNGLFGHAMPLSAAGFGRGHVGCFADQVYPIQALARLAHADNDEVALRAAEACAARIVALQGSAGQWWWHYDVRNGTVVEGYPVYSVHQHAMAPMALLDLYEAGGADHRNAVLKGVQWIDHHPETTDPLVSPDDQVIWRKVGRHEPAKLVRTVAAFTTSLDAKWHLRELETAFGPGRIDRECRPYEFGWLLYAWRASGVVDALRP